MLPSLVSLSSPSSGSKSNHSLHLSVSSSGNAPSPSSAPQLAVEKLVVGKPSHPHRGEAHGGDVVHPVDYDVDEGWGRWCVVVHKGWVLPEKLIVRHIALTGHGQLGLQGGPGLCQVHSVILNSHCVIIENNPLSLLFSNLLNLLNC